MMKYIPLLLLSLSSCCLSPRWHGCGLDDPIDQTALALPTQRLEDRMAQLRKFLDRYPGQYEFYFQDRDPPDPGVGWSYTGMIWEDLRIWTRRTKRGA